jgi:hypothetical protein
MHHHQEHVLGVLRRCRTSLVNLLDGRTVVTTGTRSTTRAASTREATGAARHTTGHTASTASATVELHHDGVGDTFKLLLLVLVLLLGGSLVLVEPADSLGDLALKSRLVRGVKLLLNLGVGDGVLERVGIRLEAVLGADTRSLSLILSLVLLGFSKHALDFLLGQATLVVGDDNLVGLAGALLESRDVDDTVGVNVEGNFDLRNTTRSGRNAREFELAEQIVVLSSSSFAFKDLDQDTRLVVGEGREGLGLLGWDSGVALDESSHDTASGLNTDGERSDVEQQDLVGRLGRGITREDSSLYSGTVGDGLIRVDGLVGLLAVEEVGDELLDTRNTGRTTDQDNLVDGRLVDLGITEDALDGLHGGAEEVLAELFEASTSDGGVEVNALVERIDLDGGLSRRRESTLGALTGSTETTQSTGVGTEVFLVFARVILVYIRDPTGMRGLNLPLEFIDEVIDQTVVEVLTTQVSVTSGRLDLEDTLFDRQQRHIESTTAKIKDENVALTLRLLVETVGDGSGGGLVDDTKDVETSDQTSILCRLSLRIVKVGWNSDDSVVDGATEVGLSSLAHLGEDHGRDFFGSESLLFALKLDLNDRLATLVNDLEGEVLHVGLHLSIGELATDEALGVEDSVGRVHGDLVLRSISDETLGVGESDKGGGGTVALVVGNDLDAVISEDANA